MMDAGIKTTEQCVEAYNKLKMEKNVRYLIYKIEGSEVHTVFIKKLNN
jgi:hypothetical protein